MLTFLLPTASDKEQLEMEWEAGRELNEIFKAQFELISRLKRRISMKIFLYKIKIYQILS